jgi:putative phosphoserine phosphatase/1-acylglycerol-3-phosphate O-acyltransferase
MQAGVPIVPVVFRNALDALPNKALVIRPATVQIVVHPPISTDDWSLEDLDERIDEIHRIFVETLEA